jgi:enoyl-CoA hydratase/carnithine racemase
MPAASFRPVTVAIEQLDDGLAALSFAVPDHRQNVITPAVVADLAAALDELEARPLRRRPRGLVIRSAREGTFFAGADVTRLDHVRSLPEAEIAAVCDRGRAVFARLSTLPWPSVAVIDGVCLAAAWNSPWPATSGWRPTRSTPCWGFPRSSSASCRAGAARCGCRGSLVRGPPWN